MKINKDDFIQTLKSRQNTEKHFNNIRQIMESLATVINYDSSPYNAIVKENLDKTLILPPSANSSQNETVGRSLLISIYEKRNLIFSIGIKRVTPRPSNKLYHLEVFPIITKTNMTKQDFDCYNNLFNQTNNALN